MIVEWLSNVGTAIVVWFTSTITGWEPDPWFVDLGDTINTFCEGLFGLGIWVNWVVVGACVATVFASWLLFGNVKFARAVAAHFPIVGGAG